MKAGFALLIVLAGVGDIGLVLWLMVQRLKQIRVDRIAERYEREFLRLYPRHKDGSERNLTPTS